MRSLLALWIFAAGLAVLPGCARGPQNAGLDPLVWVKAAENLAPVNHFAESSSGPHTVKVSTDVPHYASIQGKLSTATFAGRKLVVDFDTNRILLDDVPQATLPSGTKKVEIRFAGSKLSVTADGADVPRREANK
jgi:hypothetical protein